MTPPKDRRGQSLVEFALIVPVFVLIVVGLFDGALAVFNYSTVANAAREGARQAIVDQDPAVVRAAVQDAALSLTPSRLTVTLTPCSTISCEYVVRVDYSYQSFFLGAIFNPTLTSTVAMPVEFPNP
ncbi:MAG: pilus assembly protein [Chloroflexi bacterium]|nr:pilus assembly protein [Chloroflexota bacterium]